MNSVEVNARRKKRRLEGMTLIEIMIVVIIMALIATGATVLILPKVKEARIDSTRTDAQSIASAAEMYVIETNEGCPTVEDLVEARYLSGNKRTTDAWDNAYQIECSDDEITVMSAGPDEAFGTEDDIQ